MWLDADKWLHVLYAASFPASKAFSFPVMGYNGSGTPGAQGNSFYIYQGKVYVKMIKYGKCE